MAEIGNSFCLKQIEFYFGVLISYATYFAANLVFFLSALLLFALFPFSEERRKCSISSAMRAILNFLALRLWPLLGVYNVAQIPVLNDSIPRIYVCNHTSFLDPLFLLALIPNAGIVIKGRYKNWLAIWLLVKIFDFCALDDSSPDSAKFALSRTREILGSGRSLLIFPEGRRSKTRRLLDFKGLAFKLAAECGAEVVPCAVWSSKPFLTKGQSWFFPPRGNVFAIDFLSPLPRNLTASRLSNAAYDSISKKLAEFEQTFNG